MDAHMDTDYAHKENDRRNLHKNDTSCIEQLLEATSNKTVALQPHLSKTTQLKPN